MIDYQPFRHLLKNIVDNRGKTCPTSENGLPLIATNCISNNFLYPLFLKVRYVSDETYKTWFRGHPLPGDMIFVLKGSPGRVAWVPDPVNFCIAQDMVAIRADEEKIYPKYLFAVLRSKTIQQEIEGLHVGTLIPHFKKGDFDDLHIPVVEPGLQKFIGDQYFNVSLKIDLLHRQNKTLEALAQTLFRHWFIDGAEDDWKQVKLATLCERVSVGYVGTTTPYFCEEAKGIPLIRSQNVRPGRLDLADVKYVTPEFHEQSKKSKLQAGDVLIVRVGQNRGDCCIVPEGLGELNCANIVFARPKPSWSKFIGSFFLSPIGQHFLLSVSTGSAQGVLNTKAIASLDIPLPPKEKVIQFNEAVNYLFVKKFRNRSQILTLEKLRDTLLPKLMSGKVRVRL